MSDDADNTKFEETKQFWQNAAKSMTDAEGLRPTARDPFLQRAVETVIEKWLSPTARLLDVGCGDGASTLRFSKSVGFALGVDYIAAFVQEAVTSASFGDIQNVNFEQADAMDLSSVRSKHGLFDVVTCIRCLINLGSWSNQKQAIGELAACVKPHGLLLISEGWEDGMDGLNLQRTRAGLQAINVVDYNIMLSRGEFEKELRNYFDILDYSGLGLYLFISRVVQPLLMAPNSPRHDHPLNEIANKLQACCFAENHFPSCDYAGVYALRRRL